MTLSKQLYALIFIVSLMMGIGTLFISVENTRSYLMLQLATQTQNAADSLGLSLVPHMQNRDIAAMDTMINAMFDSGYYQSLSLKSMSGTTLIERENTSQIEGVPQWFVHQLKLETATADSIITTGWTQSGRLNLVAHPGFAYSKLWQTSIDMLWWSLLVIIISFLFASLVLKAILKPLHAVEQQALAIGEREFPIVETIPRTRELKRVVLAMNNMSAKLEGFIAKLSERAEQMRKQAHYDELTGLINRRGFNARLENIIRDVDTFGAGSLAVIRMTDFAAFNQQFGHQVGSELLAEVGKLLTELAEAHPHASPARITGTDFAMILPLADANAAADFGQILSSQLNELADTFHVDDIARIGITCFDANSKLGGILADADTALSRAEHEGVNAFSVQHSHSEAAGNEAWKALITTAIEQQHIRLLAQAVNDQSDQSRQIKYSEVLIRINDAKGDSVSPGAFSSMAERLALHSDLDRYVIEQATGLLEQDGALQLGINLSARSIRDDGFSGWLADYFSQHRDAVSRMYFEVTEDGLLHDIPVSNRFIAQVHAFGGAVVMEHFGTRLSSFQTLRQLKLDYIKIDGSYSRNISDNSDNRFFLQTVADIAHGLDIQVIAEHVETEADVQTLKALGIKMMQGYYFGEPKALI